MVRGDEGFRALVGCPRRSTPAGTSRASRASSNAARIAGVVGAAGVFKKENYGAV